MISAALLPKHNLSFFNLLFYQRPLSRMVGMPNGRLPPPGFGIITRSTGCGLYVLSRNCSLMPDNHSSKPSDSICSKVTPSTPAIPQLALANR
jgi:hypothetical protein